MIGKAFQLAFADSKFPKGTELKMEPVSKMVSDERVVQGRRWVSMGACFCSFCLQHLLLFSLENVFFFAELYTLRVQVLKVLFWVS